MATTSLCHVEYVHMYISLIYTIMHCVSVYTLLILETIVKITKNVQKYSKI